MRSLVALALAACHAHAPQSPPPEPVVIAGAFPVDRGPDGNSIILDAPHGLIVVDTGRHLEHQDKLLAYAKRAGKPIAAIVNTHWHLDHTGGNAELRAVYPRCGDHRDERRRRCAWKLLSEEPAAAAARCHASTARGHQARTGGDRRHDEPPTVAADHSVGTDRDRGTHARRSCRAVRCHRGRPLALRPGNEDGDRG